MNFFERQTQAKIRTRMLFIAFPIALLLIAVFFHVMIMGLVLLAEYCDGNYSGTILFNLVEHPAAPFVFFGSLIGVSVVVLSGSLYRFVQLVRGGGEQTARMLNGKEISPYTQRFEERQLMNVVEEMSIASGVLVPGVFILPKEFRINAFSAGFHKDSSILAITAGALEYLNREELQALVAHEFSHILNGDTRLNSLMIGVLYGLDMITQLGIAVGTGCAKVEKLNGEVEYEYVGHGGGHHPFTLIAAAILGTLIAMIGLIGTLMGALIKSAISREREFLADAAAVQFTRNPETLKSVMRKIGCPKVNSTIFNAHALEMSHVFFASAFGRNFSRFNFLGTHPNLTRRIRRLDPHFDGVYPKFVRKVKLYGKDALDAIPVPSPGMIDEILKAVNPRYGRFISRRRAAITDGIVDPRAVLAARSTDMNPALPENLEEIHGNPLGNAVFPSNLADATPPDPVKDQKDRKNFSARSLINGMSIEELLQEDPEEKQEREESDDSSHAPLPEPIRLELENPIGACSVFLALLLDLEAKDRDSLLDRLSENDLGEERLRTVREMLEILRPIRGSGPNSRKLSGDYIELRNRVLHLGMEQVRRLSPQQYRTFRDHAARIQRFHRKVDLFRYTFYAILRYDLDLHFRLCEPERIAAKYHSSNAMKESIRLSLSYLAYAGHCTSQEAQEAFESAISVFSWSDSLLPISLCTFRELDSSLKKLRYCSDSIKEKCLLAFRTCICADGLITPREEEIYRAATAMIGLRGHTNL